VRINLEDLRQHYASLTDDELLEIERLDLTDQARSCYDSELARRGMKPQSAAAPERGEESVDAAEEEANATADPGWLETAACVCTYGSQGSRTAAADAENACTILRSAGIPCQVTEDEIEPLPEPPGGLEYRVMVPSAFNLKAYAVLDRDVFNEGREASWRAHLEELTDDELRALTPDILCAGLADGIARLTRAYQEEVERRKRV